MTAPTLTTPDVIATTTPDALLLTFAALTHRIHEARFLGRDDVDLRAQRDLVQAECVRRMGGAS